MAENLVIVESPSKAKTIGNFLGKKYKVVASVGHLRDLPKSRLAVDVENNFQPQYMNIRGKADIINELKKSAKTAKNIYLATDPDREGEAISWHLASLLGIDANKPCRITFNEITKNAVLEGIKKPRPIDAELVDAYQARRVLDRIVGYKISPVLWKKVKKGLSAGRVQSVATRLICDREDEIEAFDPKEYWTITVALSKQATEKSNAKNNKTFSARFYGTKSRKIALNKKDDTVSVLEAVKNNQMRVEEIKNTEKKQSPMAPFTTSTLQQDASSKLNFRPTKTMMTAQQLYEGISLGKNGTTGLITYIRTDSVRLSDEAAMWASSYVKEKFGEEFLPKSRRVYKNKNTSQDAHEAIRPAHPELSPEDVKEYLTADQFKLYKLIYDRFIASQMADAVYSVCNVSIGAGEYIFTAKGRVTKFKGYTAVYESANASEEKDEEFNKSLPVLSEGELLNTDNVNAEQHFTQPPARYNEATLVKDLEKFGIGRPSTFAAIISTIQQRGYVGIEKKSLYPTELGRIVNEILKGSFSNIVNVEFTAELESQLDEIAQGDANWSAVIGDFYVDFAVDVEKAERELEHVKLEPKVSDVQCDKCGRMMVYRQSKYGEFLACPGFPECRNTKTIVEEVGVNCPKCSNPLIYRRSKSGRKYVACSNYPDCRFTSLNVPTGETCPECGEHLERITRRGYSFVACSNKECDYKKK